MPVHGSWTWIRSRSSLVKFNGSELVSACDTFKSTTHAFVWSIALLASQLLVHSFACFCVELILHERPVGASVAPVWTASATSALCASAATHLYPFFKRNAYRCSGRSPG